MQIASSHRLRRVSLHQQQCHHHKVIYKTPQVHLDGIINDISVMVERKMEYIKAKVEKIASEYRIPSEVCDSLQKVFDTPLLKQPFAGLETCYLQENYIAEHLGIVVSCTLYNLYMYITKNMFFNLCRVPWK